MSATFDVPALAQALSDARRRTLSYFAHLDLASLRVPMWELGHLAWFQEFWCLRYRPEEPGSVAVPSSLPEADALFDARSVPRARRWEISYPSVEGLFRYMESTLERTLAMLGDAAPGQLYFVELALRHEDLRAEAMLASLQAFGYPAPPVAGSPPASVPIGRPREVLFHGGEFLQGALPDSGEFVFDNEKWAHMVSVRPFSLSLEPVSQGEYAAFVEEGGYRRGELWTAGGWKWRESERLDAPRYWKRVGRGLSMRRFDREIPIEFSAPMLHVSLHEALAFCRWAERRLPTESEWEFAARNGGGADRFPWGDAPAPRAEGLDLHYLGPSSSIRDPAPSRTGLRQLLGGVWEWTATPFLPYPGFRPDPWKEYSEPWFGSRQVVRGGSFATRSRLVHNRFRGFCLPERTDRFTGFRTCALESQ